MSKAPLTSLQRRWLSNYHLRGGLTRQQIKKTWGWTVDELSTVKPQSNRHFLMFCPKCHSSNVAIKRHYTNMGVIGVSVVCRDCDTNVFERDYETAKKSWNNRVKIRYSH